MGILLGSIVWIFGLLLLLQQQQPSLQDATGLTPLKKPPTELLPAYTMQGLIPIEYMYVDDTNEGRATHFIYTSNDMEQLRKSMRKTLLQFESLLLRWCLPQPIAPDDANPIPSSESESNEIRKTVSIGNDNRIEFNATIAKNIIFSLPKAQWAPFVLYLNALDLVVDKELAIYGSVDPWLEVFLLLLGAKHVVTIEYNRLTYEDDRITTIAADGFTELYSAAGPYAHRFDCVISLSAFDHDGLGRYSDPINPNGDLEAMRSVQKIIKTDGKLILTVPTGPDVVVFNLHRRYGKTRLPLLIKDWDLIEKFGWIENKLEEAANWRQTYEPILMLTPKKLGDSARNEL
jgi:hypothetical protein